MNPNGFGAFGKNLHTQFDRCIITNIIFAANCDSPSPHIMIDSPQCLAYGHLIWYNLFVTTSAPKFILPDSKTIISMSFDGTVRIWDASTGVCLNTLEVDSHSVSYSPDSRTIVIASFDKTVRIYAIQSFQEMLEITRERFKDRQLTPEERHRYYLD